MILPLILFHIYRHSCWAWSVITRPVLTKNHQCCVTQHLWHGPRCDEPSWDGWLHLIPAHFSECYYIHWVRLGLSLRSGLLNFSGIEVLKAFSCDFVVNDMVLNFGFWVSANTICGGRVCILILWKELKKTWMKITY